MKDKILAAWAVIKQFLLDISNPNIFSLIIGIAVGYMLRTPIGWLLDILRFILKIIHIL